MRILRPALLTVLSTVVGLGVPAGSAQAKSAAKSSPKTASKGSSKASPKPAAKSAAPSAANSANKKTANRAISSATTRTSAASSSKSSGKKPSGKANSRRLRRQPGQKAPAAARVTEIQTALAKDGSYAGIPTGKWDEGTTAAMRKFQSTHGLNATGRLDAPTLQRLGLGSQTAGMAAPTPPPGSVSRLTSSVIAPTATDDAPR